MLFSFVFPVLVEPIFNKYKPLSDARIVQRLRDDLETLSSGEWLHTSSELTLIDEQDNSLRNDIMRLISGFQWRGLSVHVTGSGDGIYRLAPATAGRLGVRPLPAASPKVRKTGRFSP